MVHRRLIILLIAAFYYGLAAYGLHGFESGLLMTGLVLYGLPAFALARFSNAPPAVLLSVMALGIGVAVLLEGVAHMYGLWFTLGTEGTRLFGLVAFEALVVSVLQVMFLALLYENLFDDGVYTAKSARARAVPLMILAGGSAFVVALHNYLFTEFFLERSYLMVVLGMLAVSFIALASYRAFSVQFLDRLVYFLAAAVVPLGIGLFLAIENTHRIFFHFNEYVYTVDLWRQSVPLEEILLILAVPILVATVYEIYLDDRR